MSGGWQGSDRKARLPEDWSQRRQRILIRDKRTCQIVDDGCLITATEVDHIHAGDDHDDTNLQAVCSECHAHKSAREGVEARTRILTDRRRPTPRHPGLRG